jgi:hypothetical protein
MTRASYLTIQDMNAPNDEYPCRGAYGYRIAGVSRAQALLVRAPAHWPKLELEVCVTAEPPPPRERVTDQVAVLRPRSGGWVSIDRTVGKATFSLPERPTDAALIHPHLASVAAIFAHWQRRETFHAGAFVVDGKVWGLLGEREAGKSSFLASLALGGVPVLCDDILVLDDLTAFAGPRSIDLRADAARHLAAGEPLGVVGTRERWRLMLESVPAELPLGGWISLRWDDRIQASPVRGSDRLRELGAHRGLSLYPPKPETLIELSALPFMTLRRPRRWGSGDDAVKCLLDALL